MLEVFLKTNFDKINTKVNVKNLMAGIIYDKNDKPIGKMLFIKNDHIAANVFNDEQFSLIKENESYVGDTVSLAKITKDFLQKSELNLVELYMVYKMFLNDESFLMNHLEYFGLTKMEVGYKCKEIAKPMYIISDPKKIELFNKLVRIIYFRSTPYLEIIDDSVKGKGK